MSPLNRQRGLRRRRVASLHWSTVSSPVQLHGNKFTDWKILTVLYCKRTFKNPFASRLAESDNTLKLLRITDQWYIVPVKFRFGRNRDFLALLLLPLARGSDLIPVEGLFLLPADHTCSDNLERNTQIWNSNKKDYARKKPLRYDDDTEEILWN